MSQRNLALAGEVVDAVVRQDLSRLLELTDPEVEWGSFVARLGEQGASYHGHDGMRQYIRDISDAFEFLRPELGQSIAVGEVVVLVGHLGFRAKAVGPRRQPPRATWSSSGKGESSA